MTLLKPLPEDSKNLMKIWPKSLSYLLIFLLFLAAGFTVLVFPHLTAFGSPVKTATTSVQFVSSTIVTDGVVTAQTTANLNFQTGGKLVYVPYKVGDMVPAGRTIAQLDSYILQRQLTLALNAYKTTRENFDQTQQNYQDQLLKSQVSPAYTNAQMDFTTAVDDAIKRLLDQSQAGLDNSVINVEIANYALELSRLTAPFKGVITREDVTVPGLNISPATTFTLADPASMVFRANIPLENIYYVSVGSQVTLAIDGLPDKLTGVVTRIYPTKVVTPGGQSVYQVDIENSQLQKNAKLDMTGTAIITTHSENVALVPAWTVLGGRYIWVDNNGQSQLREVTVGAVHGDKIEVTAGLSPRDRIITDPKSLTAPKYPLL